MAQLTTPKCRLKSLLSKKSLIALSLPKLAKPKFKDSCNGCGYCCTVGPCQLAQEFLGCTEGPCIALEAKDGRTVCGLVRNPLGYLFKAADPDADFDVLAQAPQSEAGFSLSSELARALGLGMGCDSADDEESVAWNAGISRG